MDNIIEDLFNMLKSLGIEGGIAAAIIIAIVVIIYSNRTANKISSKNNSISSGGDVNINIKIDNDEKNNKSK